MFHDDPGRMYEDERLDEVAALLAGQRGERFRQDAQGNGSRRAVTTRAKPLPWPGCRLL
jgi:hypothetical protein